MGAPCLLSMPVWSSSKWSYIDNCSLLFNVVSLEGKKQCFEDYERSIPDLKLFFFRTFLDWLFALQNQLFSSIFDFLDLVISVFNPVHSLCTRVFLFDINKSYYLSKKRKKEMGNLDRKSVV